jgi:hypothetical protein
MQIAWLVPVGLPFLKTIDSIQPDPFSHAVVEHRDRVAVIPITWPVKSAAREREVKSHSVEIRSRKAVRRISTEPFQCGATAG